MKKISLIALFAALVMSVNAADLWTGEKHVSWDDGGIDLAAEKLADAKAGNLLKVHYSAAKTNIELKVMEVWHALPGARFEAWIEGAGVYEQFLTATAAAEIKEHGLQVIGGDITVTKIELLDGKAELKEGAIWTGYFWMDNWSTMKLAMEGLAIDWSKYKELVIYHEANRTDYVVNILSQFDVEGAKVPDAAVTKGSNDVVVDLTKVDMDAVFAAANEYDQKSLKVQMNKESGNAFNITDIVLVPKSDPTAFENVQGDNVQCTKIIRNGQVLILRDGRTYNAQGIELK